MDLVAMHMADSRRKFQSTVLHRPNGTWHDIEVSLLVDKLRTVVSQLPRCPEYLILFGHYTKEQTLAAIGGGIAFTATQMTGVDKLPFSPF